MRLRQCLVLLCVSMACALTTTSKRKKSREPFWFAQSFVFGGSDLVGKDGTFKYKASARGLYMLLYVEEDASKFGELVAKKYSEETMRERFAQAEAVRWIGPGDGPEDAGAMTTVSGEFTYDGGAPRWLYVVFSNYDRSCNSECGSEYTCNLEYVYRCYGNVDVEFEWELKNGDSEFSWDEEGLYVTYCVLVAYYTAFLMSLSLIISMGLISRNKFHPTAKLLILSVALSAVASVLILAYYDAKRRGEQGSEVALRSGYYVNACSDGILASTLILFAEGYNVARRKLAGRARLQVAIFVSTYVIALFCVESWYHIKEQEAEPGYAIIVIRLAAACWILRAALSMKAHFRSKAGFYAAFCMVAGLWSFTPAIVATVAALSEDYDRHKVTRILQPVLVAMVHTLLLFIIAPIRFINPYCFPYHSETTNAALNHGIKWESRNNTTSLLAASSDADMARRRAANPALAAASSAAVVGGRGAGVNSRGKYLAKDGFEALHITRLKHVQNALEQRLGALERLARELDETVRLVDLTDSADLDGSPRSPESTLAPNRTYEGLDNSRRIVFQQEEEQNNEEEEEEEEEMADEEAPSIAADPLTEMMPLTRAQRPSASSLPAAFEPPEAAITTFTSSPRRGSSSSRALSSSKVLPPIRRSSSTINAPLSEDDDSSDAERTPSYAERTSFTERLSFAARSEQSTFDDAPLRGSRSGSSRWGARAPKIESADHRGLHSEDDDLHDGEDGRHTTGRRRSNSSRALER